MTPNPEPPPPTPNNYDLTYDPEHFEHRRHQPNPSARLISLPAACSKSHQLVSAADR